ncbi:MAG TPA: mycofactocin biosynthesis glycosyltransferase MftF, partial [Acidimicrobiales bacterium]|nr:mycofactocin biosynthesis glycosyltransferase MftF [Acidimicrobiales bacterium]
MTVATPEDLGVPSRAAMPRGMSVVLDPATRQLAGDVLFGGAPPRLLRLSGTGVGALAELRSGPVRSSAGASLARRLTDAGLAHPVPGPPPDHLDLTVVVPVRDRLADLRECLRCLGTAHPVVVVDDGSADPDGVRAACDAAGARLVRRPVAGGPAAARNAGLATVATDLVAFVDSDCRVTPGWVDGLVGHLADPLVAGVAPRVAPAAPSLLGSPLDLGDRPAGVVPMTRVAYLPTAALVVRRRALGDGFDDRFRYGEDVDLVWQLLDAGWRLRYEPAVQVTHREPPSTGGLLRRRFHYGTSAAPLARRHPGHLTHLVVAPAPAATVGALVAGRPGVAAAA